MSIRTLDCICAVVLFIALFIVLFSSCGKAPEKSTEPYDYSAIEAAFLRGFSDYELYDSSVLTGDILRSRKCLIIERCIGTVTDASTGDGRLLNPSDPEYDYIAYRSCGFPLKDGEIVLTYFLYDRYGCDVDDIAARYDFVLSE